MTVDCTGFSAIVIAGIELPVVDHQLAVEQMQFFAFRMAVRRIFGSGREAYQYADPLALCISRE
jgi:hypothetical protein